MRKSKRMQICKIGEAGQALVEAALIAPLIVFFLFGIIWFAGVVLTWQQLVGAARYGTDLLVYTPLGDTAIKRDITNYLCNKKTAGRILDSNKLDIKIVFKDAVPINYTLSFENIFSSEFFSKINTIKDLFPVPETSYIEIRYKYKAPRLLRLVSGREDFWLKTRSEVLTGDGSAGYNKRQS
jgi:hypothetical protein